MSRSRRFLLLSFAIHFALLLAACFIARGRRVEAPPAVMVELPPMADSAPSEGDAGKSTKTAKVGRAQRSVMAPGGLAKALPLSALAPAWSKQVGNPSAPKVQGGDGEEEQTSAEVVTAKASGPMMWVFRKTKNVVGYPSEFIRHEIQGSVVAHFSFDREGKLDPSRLEVRADSPYLRVYIYRLLEKTFFDDVIPAELRSFEKRLDVTCTVRFQFSETGVSYGFEQRVAGNRIFLQKNHAKSKLAWNLGPLSGVAGVPALGVDVLWFARKAKEAVKPSIHVDDLAPYKNDPLFYN